MRPPQPTADLERQILEVLVRHADTESGLLSVREITRAVEQLAGRPIPYGQVYTQLETMEEAGQVTSREDVHRDRRARCYTPTERAAQGIRTRPSPDPDRET